MSKVHCHIAIDFKNDITREDAIELREKLEELFYEFYGDVTSVRYTAGENSAPWEQLSLQPADLGRVDL